MADSVEQLRGPRRDAEGCRCLAVDARSSGQRKFWRGLTVLLVLALALAVRSDRARRTPVLADDVIRHIKQGQALFQHPLQAVRDEPYHPLHSALTALTYVTVVRHLNHDARSAWLASAQVVGVASALAVTLMLMGLSRRLGAPWWAAVGAGILWTVGRRTAFYGADGLSDMLCLALFTGALLVGMGTRLRWRPWAWLAGGLLAGLSYLTRPEGAGAVLILAGAVLLYYLGFHPRWFWQRRRRQVRGNRGAFPWADAWAILGMMVLGFLLVGGPYMVAIGGFTAKKDLFHFLGSAAPVRQAVAPLLAAPGSGVVPASCTIAGSVVDSFPRVGVWERVGIEFTETFGFAPCLVVLGAILLKPRLWGRGHWRALVLVWVVLWFAIMVWLRVLAGYLDGRHTLALQLVLHCLFALALPVWERPMRWWQAWWRGLKNGAVWRGLPGWMRWGGWPKVMGPGALVLGCLPGIIMLHEPPARDRVFILEGAAWLAAHTEPQTFIADSTGQLAYYAGREHQPWPGHPEDWMLGLAVDVPRSLNRPVVLAYVYQTDAGQIIPPRIGDYDQVKVFPAVGSRHWDILVIYARPHDGLK